MILNSPYISGSLTVTGNTTIQGQLTVTGSLSGTASLASNALLLQGTGSTGFATTSSLLEVSSSQQQISSSQQQISASFLTLTASYNAVSASQQQISSSQQQISSSYIALSASYNTFSGSASTRVTQIEQVYATTGSNSFRADQSITGSLVVSSTITAQTLVVQTVTSSILYSSGSNIFGNQLANTQTFTGSVNITGSLNVVTTGTEFQVTNTGVILGNLSTDNHAITGSLNMTGSLGINAASSFRFNGVGDNSHAVGYDATVDGAFLRGQNGIRLITGGGSGIERMRISAAGTASFTSNTLSNSADAATINLKQNSTTANTGIYLERSGEQKGYYIYMGGSVDSLTFQRNNAGTKADVMSLTRDGNVGILCSSPGFTLDVNGSLNVCTSTGAQISLINYGGSSAKIRGSKGTLAIEGCGAITLETNGANERVRVNVNGETAFSCQICALSGLRFGIGATTLNYFEEGCWQPVLRDSNNSTIANDTYTNSGRYTRIGNRVFFSLYSRFNLSGVGSGDGGFTTNLRISLPFTACSTAPSGIGENFAPINISYWSSFYCLNSGDFPSGYIRNGENNAQLTFQNTGCLSEFTFGTSRLTRSASGGIMMAGNYYAS